MLAQHTAVEAANAKTWVDRREVLEDHLRTADVVKMEDIGLGVTKPRRAYLAPGGPIDRIAWKTIRSGIHQGYWESYKSEIGAIIDRRDRMQGVIDKLVAAKGEAAVFVR